MHSVDVLVVTAIKEEYDAARALGGLSSWADHDEDEPAPYSTARYGRLAVALARPTRMGGRNTSPITTILAHRLRPACLAMCGVCAGKPGATAPGDVVVATSAYEWDEGKQTARQFRADHQAFELEDRWVRAVQEFEPSGLRSHGVATEEEAELWYLERLLKKQDPRNHPSQDRYFPRATWETRLERLRANGFVQWQDGQFVLTEPGRTHIEQVLYIDVDGPDRMPFVVRPGAMASGSSVRANSRIWAELEVRKRDTLAVDMEAATIATVARDQQIRHWLVAKGVMDHADPGKDDRFKAFAARASAEVLFELLQRLLKPPPPAMHVPGPVRHEFTLQLRYRWPDVAGLLGVPAHETRRFRAGDESHDLWRWLEQQRRLADLPEALDEIGLSDLAERLRPHL